MQTVDGPLGRRRILVVTDPDTAGPLLVALRLAGAKPYVIGDPAVALQSFDRVGYDAAVISFRAAPRAAVLAFIGALNRPGPLIACDAPDLAGALDAARHGAADVVLAGATAAEVVVRLAQALTTPQSPAPAAQLGAVGAARLTDRERQVLDQIVAGNSNKQTAYALQISPRTVEVHRRRVMEKLGARSTVHLLRIVLGVE